MKSQEACEKTNNLAGIKLKTFFIGRYRRNCHKQKQD